MLPLSSETLPHRPCPTLIRSPRLRRRGVATGSVVSEEVRNASHIRSARQVRSASPRRGPPSCGCTLTSLNRNAVIGSTRSIAETSHVLGTYRQRASPPARIPTSRSLAQEDVVGGVGYAEIRAGGGAGALHRTAARIDALDGGNTGQHAVAAPFDDFELQ